ncbi:hypothetical protein [Bradyrhizobium liaoningense]|uniref:hypothetical protein n=1 Tax=Bradyrhizobium liaoningense TaxID=43992 RepID=UPI001BABF825|nr:hypothetical protein [Bradyrhizobium liaoningense]MBR0907020.1 hypothetical protein [Bradyrhizobium liaoningense]
MMKRIDVVPLVHRLEDIAWLAIENAVCREGVTLGEIATAAAALNAASEFRRRCGAMGPELEAIHEEYRVCLSLALMKIDGDDLDGVQAVADLIYPRVKP